VFTQLVPEHEKSAIDISEFKKLYGEAQINRDRESVRNKKAHIKEAHTEPTHRAKILEALLSQQIELSNWFGEDALTIVPSEYDDLFNGVDVAIEFERADSYRYMAAGIDVTSSSQAIDKKLGIIKSHILDEALTKMKYFFSERADSRGEKSKIPAIVIGTDIKMIRELCEIWLNANKQRLGRDLSGLSETSIENQKRIVKEALEKLANHRIQVLLLREIEMQSEKYLDFARKNEKFDAAQKYENLLNLVRELLSEKKISPEDEIENESDTVFQALKFSLAGF